MLELTNLTIRGTLDQFKEQEIAHESMGILFYIQLVCRRV